MTDEKDKQQDQFLDQIRTLVEYWDGTIGNVPNSRNQRERLEGLAHSLLTTIDQGNLALVPAGVLEAHGLDDADLAGILNDRLFNEGIWSEH